MNDYLRKRALQQWYLTYKMSILFREVPLVSNKASTVNLLSFLKSKGWVLGAPKSPAQVGNVPKRQVLMISKIISD